MKQQWLDSNPDECFRVRGKTWWKTRIRVLQSLLQGERGFLDRILHTPNRTTFCQELVQPILRYVSMGEPLSRLRGYMVGERTLVLCIVKMVDMSRKRIL